MSKRVIFDDLKKNSKFILPDLETTLLLNNSNFFDSRVMKNVFFVEDIYEDLKRLNVENFSFKEKEILESKVKHALLKMNSEENSKFLRMQRMYRDVRNNNFGLSKADYNLVLSGAAISVLGENVSLISNSDLVFSAYLGVLNKNSYLKRDNFKLYSFNEDYFEIRR